MNKNMSLDELSPSYLKMVVDEQELTLTNQLQEGSYSHIIPVFGVFLSPSVMGVKSGEKPILDVEIDHLPDDYEERIELFRQLGKSLVEQGMPVIGTLFIHQVNMHMIGQENGDVKNGLVITATNFRGDMSIKVLELTEKAPLKVVDVFFEDHANQKNIKADPSLMRSFWRSYIDELKKQRVPYLN